jgi:hypothetical protein
VFGFAFLGTRKAALFTIEEWIEIFLGPWEDSSWSGGILVCDKIIEDGLS